MARECSGSLRRPLLVNLSHDLIGVLHSIGNGADRYWHFLGAWVLRQLAGREDRSSNQQNALAPLVHGKGFYAFAFCSSRLSSSAVKKLCEPTATSTATKESDPVALNVN